MLVQRLNVTGLQFTDVDAFGNSTRYWFWGACANDSKGVTGGRVTIFWPGGGKSYAVTAFSFVKIANLAEANITLDDGSKIRVVGLHNADAVTERILSPVVIDIDLSPNVDTEV
jgi:hypothetical protein